MLTCPQKVQNKTKQNKDSHASKEHWKIKNEKLGTTCNNKIIKGQEKNQLR